MSKKKKDGSMVEKLGVQHVSVTTRQADPWTISMESVMKGRAVTFSHFQMRSLFQMDLWFVKSVRHHSDCKTLSTDPLSFTSHCQPKTLAFF